MNSKAERFYHFIKNDKTQGFIAFILYIIFIVELTNLHLPLVLQGICSIVSTSVLVFIIPICIIYEEFIFRLLPYKFIKNKILYIVISALVFAGMHVVNDTNAFYNIWFYLPNALYLGYRYYKTNDLLVTISIHIFNNLLATLPLILSYF